MRGPRHPALWARHPRVVDGLIVVAVVTVGVLSELASTGPDGQQYEFRDANAFSLAVTAVATLALAQRRHRPVTVYATAYVGAWVLGIGEFSSSGPWLAMLFGLYAVTAYGTRRWAAVLSLASTLALGVLAMFDPGGMGRSDLFVGLFAMPVAAWVMGDGARVRRAYVSAVEDRAASLEREQDAQAERAVMQERNRIGRELHDIVAHNVSVMVVQAGAARRTLERDPGRATEAIEDIETTGRHALEEMRRLVGVLRTRDHRGDAPDDDAALLPQPGLDDIPALVARWHQAGLQATFRVDGDPRPLPPGMELVVFRIVQEALTNTVKHGGPAARSEAVLRYDDDAVTLSVTDDGRGAAATATAGADDARTAGHGLVGMVERVTLYDGEMRWGPQQGGGFRVWVRLPLTGREVGQAARPVGAR